MSNYTYGYCHGNVCVCYSDALCQTRISVYLTSIKGQSVGKFYIYWRNWRSLCSYLWKTLADVIIALYQTFISDIKGQSVGKFYIYWCNWRSLKPFLSRVILTHKDDDDDDDYGQITVWERELPAF